MQTVLRDSECLKQRERAMKRASSGANSGNGRSDGHPYFKKPNVRTRAALKKGRTAHTRRQLAEPPRGKFPL